MDVLLSSFLDSMDEGTGAGAALQFRVWSAFTGCILCSWPRLLLPLEWMHPQAHATLQALQHRTRFAAHGPVHVGHSGSAVHIAAEKSALSSAVGSTSTTIQWSGEYLRAVNRVDRQTKHLPAVS